MQHVFDTLILGAGGAGLAAARRLSQNGQRVIVLEARDRVGGRVHTLHEQDWPVPVELGAEFVHGRPRETWDIIRAADLNAYDVPDEHLHLTGGRLRKIDHFWSRVDDVMARMEKLRRPKDNLSFAEYVRERRARRARHTDHQSIELGNLLRRRVQRRRRPPYQLHFPAPIERGLGEN